MILRYAVVESVQHVAAGDPAPRRADTRAQDELRNSTEKTGVRGAGCTSPARAALD